MSTLSNTDLTVADANITTLKDASGNNPSTPSAIAEGRAKCWCTFDESGTLADSFNTASITDNATGDWTVNIDTDMSNANYAFACSVNAEADVNNLTVGGIAAFAAGTLRIAVKTAHTGSNVDEEAMSVIIFGDQ